MFKKNFFLLFEKETITGTETLEEALRDEIYKDIASVNNAENSINISNKDYKTNPTNENKEDIFDNNKKAPISEMVDDLDINQLKNENIINAEQESENINIDNTEQNIVNPAINNDPNIDNSEKEIENEKDLETDLTPEEINANLDALNKLQDNIANEIKRLSEVAKNLAGKENLTEKQDKQKNSEKYKELDEENSKEEKLVREELKEEPSIKNKKINELELELDQREVDKYTTVKENESENLKLEENQADPIIEKQIKSQVDIDLEEIKRRQRATEQEFYDDNSRQKHEARKKEALQDALGELFSNEFEELEFEEKIDLIEKTKKALGNAKSIIEKISSGEELTNDEKKDLVIAYQATNKNLDANIDTMSNEDIDKKFNEIQEEFKNNPKAIEEFEAKTENTMKSCNDKLTELLMNKGLSKENLEGMKNIKNLKDAPSQGLEQPKQDLALETQTSQREISSQQPRSSGLSR